MFTDEIRADSGVQVTDDVVIADVAAEIAGENYYDLSDRERTAILLHRSGVHDDALVADMAAFDLVGIGAMDAADCPRVFKRVF